MGQYKTILRAKLDQQRIQEQLETIEAKIAQAIKDKPIIDIAELRKQLAIPENIPDEDIIDIIKRHKPKTPIKLREYHWYNEPPTAKHQINTKKLKELIEELVKSYRARDIKDLMTRVLGIPKSKAETYMEWLKSNTKRLAIKDLITFCRDFTINPRKLEEHNVFIDYKFPIKIEGNTALIKLKTHVLNEGTLLRKPAPRAKYENKDPILHAYVKKLLEEIGAKTSTPIPSKEAIATFIDATTARLLHATGIPYGSKTKTNPPLDPETHKNPELRKYHIQTTLTEEGSTYLTIVGQTLLMGIYWSRTIDITDKLTPQQIEQLKKLTGPTKKERKIPIDKVMMLFPEIYNIVKQQAPSLLEDEIKALREAHIDQVDKDAWPKPRLKNLYVSKRGRVTATWSFKTHSPKIVRILCEQYGMLPGSWKDERAKRQYEIYKKYGGKKLTRQELDVIKKLIRETPKRITEDWLKEKMEQFFPEATWIKDLEKLKRLFKHERK